MAEARKARAAISIACGAGLTATAVTFAILGGASWSGVVDSYTLTNLVIGLSFLLPGAAIRWHVPRNRIATLLIVSGIGALSSAAAMMMVRYGIAHDWPRPVLRALTTVFIGAWQLGIGLCFDVVLLLFPTDRLLSPRWRPVLWLTVLTGTYQLLSGVMSSAHLDGHPDAVSLLSVGWDVQGTTYNAVIGYLGLGLAVLTVAGLVLRYRRGDERVKRQVQWLLLALLVILIVNSQRYLSGSGAILLLLTFALIPVAIGVAVVRHELFDIRFVLSRTLLYTTTVAVVVAAFAGLVAVLSATVSDRLSPGVPTGAALAVAITFNPLRIRLQRLIDRAFYGGRSDPAGTARDVGEQLRQADELADVVDRARLALRLPWMTLVRLPDGAELAKAGGHVPGAGAAVPLTYRGEPVGTLRLGLRRGEATLHESDRHTLELICTPLAIALHATALAEQVRQARTATIEAAAAERVRLQHELHDGLGPVLTSIAFRADAAANVMRTDLDRADGLIGEVRTELRAVIGDIRRIVYGLRPLELEDLGLVGALRQHIAAIPEQHRRPLRVELAAPDPMPTLSPAVELAAYRIAVEGITNALRHSTGRSCRVAVTVGDDLEVTVTDDGDAPEGWRPGVGLRSIDTRAEELGGTAHAAPGAAGWTVRARLPLQRHR